MTENGTNISRRGFVAGAGATALAAGLAGYSSTTAFADEAAAGAVAEKVAYDPNEGE